MLLCGVFLQLWQAGATLQLQGAASHCGGLACYRAGLQGMWASVLTAHGLSCSTAGGILPDQGSNPRLLQLTGGLPTTEPPGKPVIVFFIYLLWLRQVFAAAHRRALAAGSRIHALPRGADVSPPGFPCAGGQSLGRVGFSMCPAGAQ